MCADEHAVEPTWSTCWARWWTSRWSRSTSSASAGTRFRLLETLRQFGSQALDARKASQDGRPHLVHYVGVAERARGLVQGAGHERGAACSSWRIEDNLRSALSWGVRTADAAATSTLVVASFWYSFFFQRHQLGTFAEQALPLAGISPMVHGVAGLFTFQAGEIKRRIGNSELVSPWDRSLPTMTG